MDDSRPAGIHRGPSGALFPFPGPGDSSPRQALAGGGLKVLGRVALLNAVLFSLFLAVATPVYETNDDLTMQAVASGLYTGQPDEHLVFTSVLIGWTLRFLYATWHGCNWYLVYLMAVHYAAMTAIGYVVVSRRRAWRFVLLYVAFFLMAETRILLRPQFTTAAFLAGTAGLLLLVDGFRPGDPVHRPKIIAGFAFVALMGMIREPVAPLLALIALPFLIERFGRTGRRRLVAAGVIGAVVFLTFHELNRWYYRRDAGWGEFLQYNRLRGEIHGTRLVRYAARAAHAAGWTENDAGMFTLGFMSDPDVYASVPRLRLFLNELKRIDRAEGRNLAEFHLFLPKYFSYDSGILMELALLGAAGCLAAAGRSWRRYFVPLLVMYGMFAGISFYLLGTARLPERVSYTMPLFTLAICLYWATGFSAMPADVSVPNILRRLFPGLANPGAGRLIRQALLVIWMALCVFLLFRLGRSLRSWDFNNRSLKAISHRILTPVRTLLPAGKRPLLVAMPLDSILELCQIFYSSPEEVPFDLVPYGWLTHSPLYNQILDRHRLRPFSLSLVDRPDVFFLMERRWLEPLRIFYREHYRLDIRFEMVLNTDEMPQYHDCRVYLYQAHAVPAPAPLPPAP